MSGPGRATRDAAAGRSGQPGPRASGSDLKPRRVHILGGMGTGKTFLAGRLGAVLSAPVYEMDLGFDADSVLAKERWVTEGIYLWEVEAVLDAADVVLWLDLPYRTCARRIVLQHLWASARRQNRHKGLRRLWNFAWEARRYWSTSDPRPPAGATDWGALSRAQTVVTLEPYSAKVHRLSSRSEVAAWLQRLRVATAAEEP